MISTNGSDYFDADSADAALLLKNAQRNIVFYKVILENKTSVALANVEISDVFETQQSLIKQLLVRNVKGATYDNGTFTIEKIEKNSESIFTYQATLNTNSINENSSAYNQVEVIDYETV